MNTRSSRSIIRSARALIAIFAGVSKLASAVELPQTSNVQTAHVSSWPGSAAVATADAAQAFAGNLSGLAYRAARRGEAAILWAVENNPSKLYRLELDSGVWAPRKVWTVVYPDGSGVPDAEAVTIAEADSEALYVATERDNAQPGVSRLSILRVDPRAEGTTLVATHEWNLTASLPPVAPNLGFEAITWVPDAVLVADGFRVEESGRLYDPRDYPGHGGGLFFAGVEASGVIYVFALDHRDSSFRRVAAIASGQPHVMELAFDRDENRLWSWCDDTCSNRVTLLAIDEGRFSVLGAFERPRGMANLDNEGIAFVPESECIDGSRAFFWSDDKSTGGHAIRTGSIECGKYPRRDPRN